MEQILVIVGSVVAAIVSGIFAVYTNQKARSTTRDQLNLNSLQAAAKTWESSSKENAARLDRTFSRLDKLESEVDRMKSRVSALESALSASRRYIRVLLSWIEEKMPNSKPPAPPRGYEVEGID